MSLLVCVCANYCQISLCLNYYSSSNKLVGIYVYVSPPVQLLILLDFKQIDKNPRGDNDAQQKKKTEEKRRIHKEKDQNL